MSKLARLSEKWVPNAHLTMVVSMSMSVSVSVLVAVAVAVTPDLAQVWALEVAQVVGLVQDVAKAATSPRTHVTSVVRKSTGPMIPNAKEKASLPAPSTRPHHLPLLMLLLISEAVLNPLCP